ncbi:hypothetical protein SARC_07061 [Sphaeroforma arctica JP610]|uniref:Copper transport protein n=1 Tax=Sphaeroforma arctica JP610 TaxID=667725 RepID=A0A0L0FUT9_9EUKA|nr:hypothetical protein SARC_07061 [Sphaeroforma arctica JP610]KNC80577.1 hypothetical protein SARC_07061 [Sphaeroforma arctica JP610]|eukprot:XP_014154479.1 hypothetical protein SARC_07061 [Sphaeroforma arctica JP610]
MTSTIYRSTKLFVLYTLLQAVIVLAQPLDTAIGSHTHNGMSSNSIRLPANDATDTCPHGSTCCPVCGMALQIDDSFKLVYNEGQYLNTCSLGCAHKLADDPLLYQTSNSEGILASGSALEQTDELSRKDQETDDHISDHNAGDLEGKQCPVCGMQATKEHYIHFKGRQSLWFCGMSNQVTNFFEAPRNYLRTIKHMKKDVEDVSYCSGRTVMFMYDGFTTQDTTCIVLWFSWFVLDSRFKMMVGMLACFGLAVFHEYMSSYRRGLVYLQRMQALEGRPRKGSDDSTERTTLIVSPGNRGSNKHRRNKKLDATVALLHGLSLVTGYLAMLAAMTYSTYLFLSVIAGFSTGQYLFRDCDAPIAPGDTIEVSGDPCCAV